MLFSKAQQSFEQGFVSKMICLQGVFKMEVILSTVLNLESVYPAICICVHGKSNILIWGLNLYHALMYFSSDPYLRFWLCFVLSCYNVESHCLILLHFLFTHIFMKNMVKVCENSRLPILLYVS